MVIKIAKLLGKPAKYVGAALVFVVAASQVGADETKPQSWQSLIDMSRADVSTFSLKLINDGADVGSMTYGWILDGNRYIVSDRTEMKPNILETATGIINADTLLPESITVDFAVGENTRKYDVAWTTGGRTGGVVISQPDTETRTVDFGSTERPVSALRLSIFGLIAGLPLKEGFSVKMPWYNTLSNKLQDIELTHAGIATIETPAGTFEAHKIDLTGGTPENIIYVSTGLPQKIVRIDVVGQPMHFERLP